LKYEDLVLEALGIIQIDLQAQILSVDLDLDAGRLKVVLKNRIQIYIRYNNFNEYSYVVLFSFKKGDRVQFDNFDKNWPVKSRPHHCHPRFTRAAIDSTFNGVPPHDMPLLCNSVKSKDIFKIQ